MMSLTKTFFNLITGHKTQKTPVKESNQARPKISPKISREELREFLINNNLQGELLKDVTELKSQYKDLTNYQAVEFLMDHNERSNH